MILKDSSVTIMKHFLSHRLFERQALYLLGAVLSVIVLPANAQKPVNGNGRIIEQIRPLSNFTAVSLDFTATVTIVNGQTPSFRIEADENVLPFIGTKVRGRTLMITQDRWIEPSQSVMIHIGVPFIARLETSGYNTVRVDNLDGPRLQVETSVGEVLLNGNAERLQIRTRTGTVDATELEVSYADVVISSHGMARFGELEELITNVSDNGTVVYAETPDQMSHRNDQARIVSIVEYEEDGAAEGMYIEVVLVNNSRKQMNLRVEGPRERSFGYGFTMKANDRRKERWPVGTKVYSEGRLLSDELLVTLIEDMEGNNVYLFKED